MIMTAMLLLLLLIKRPLQQQICARMSGELDKFRGCGAGFRSAIDFFPSSHKHNANSMTVICLRLFLSSSASKCKKILSYFE